MNIPGIKKINRDASTGRPDALKLKIKIKTVASKNVEPLNGFPDNHAKADTDNKGRQSKNPKSLFEGDHFSSRAARNK